jgi:DNA polymerase I-like protein with 3'-5' exonuclease and polymerase domains
VHHKHNKIDIIGVYDGESYHLFPTIAIFDDVRIERGWKFVFHNGKFDYKSLKEKGSTISLDHYVGDTQLLGACVYNKVSDSWLRRYNEKRAELNEALPPKQRHRVGTPLSLKTMAPYYLQVKPFWENPASHDDPEYNKTDCIHTYNLYSRLLVLADTDGTREFYENYLLPWQKLLVEAELEGVLIDEKLLHEMYATTIRDLSRLEEEVHRDLGPCFAVYRCKLENELREESAQKCDDYILKRIKNRDKEAGVRARYAERLTEHISRLPERFNLASNPQMLQILTWAGIDTLVEKRDKETNEWVEKEGTDKFILKRAKVQGNGFADLLLRYREKETEVQYLKQYINACVEGRIYCGFSIVGTRTGRLSSSGPNLQNVKGSLRAPFIVADQQRYSIYTVDASQIEPRVIAYESQDPKLIKLFQDGRDYHNYATHLFFPETRSTPEKDIKKVYPELRNKVAKTGDLSLIYGTGPATLKTMCLVRGELDVPLDECKKWAKDFKCGMEHVLDFKRNLESRYKNGERLKDKFGYPVQARDEAIHMTLFNTFVQGMASRMIFHASLMAFREFQKKGIDARPLMWIHDEVVWRVPKGLALECKEVIDKYMKSYKLETPLGRVPLDVEGHIADRWTK